MKKGRVILIVCLTLTVALLGVLILRALIRQNDVPALMEEDDLLTYIADFTVEDTAEQSPDLLWDSASDGASESSKTITPEY